MGKITGFLEFPRQPEPTEPVAKRVKDFREFVHGLDDDTAKIQAARCMDCAIPYCHSQCPVNNNIPEFNDLVYHGKWREALECLLSTNNFPEFTGRICPAPCETGCTLNLQGTPVGIKSIEHKIIDKGWEMGWVLPKRCAKKTGKKIAVIGSGPAGLACAQQLARVGHAVTVFEQHDRLGGLLRYGIPDFKLEKVHIDKRIDQMRKEDVEFRTSVYVGNPEDAKEMGKVTVVTPAELDREFDAIVLAGGSKKPRDLPIPGRELDGIHFAMDFLPPQNKRNAGDSDAVAGHLRATGKHVLVIGGGDTGSDCVGTSHRHGARSVTQFELMPKPPEHEDTLLVWPYWPVKLRTSSSHEEGGERDWSVATKCFNGDGHGKVKSVSCVRLSWAGNKMSEIAGSEFEVPAELVLLAMGFVSPMEPVLNAFGVEKNARGNVKSTCEGPESYKSNLPKIFAAGDMRRGQSLVVWAIREGRQCAHAVDLWLMGETLLPR